MVDPFTPLSLHVPRYGVHQVRPVGKSGALQRSYWINSAHRPVQEDAVLRKRKQRRSRQPHKASIHIVPFKIVPGISTIKIPSPGLQAIISGGLAYLGREDVLRLQQAPTQVDTFVGVALDELLLRYTKVS